jgi:hypothetical protein
MKENCQIVSNYEINGETFTREEETARDAYFSECSDCGTVMFVMVFENIPQGPEYSVRIPASALRESDSCVCSIGPITACAKCGSMNILEKS